MKKNLSYSKQNNLPPQSPFTEYIGFSARTIPALFLERCAKTPDNVAFRVKELGIYRDVCWYEYLEMVENFYLGLCELGLKPGDKVAIMGDPCPEWLYADLATQSAGAISYGIYPTSSQSEIRYLMQHGEAKFFVAEDQEYVDKVLAVADDLPRLAKIIVVDTRAMFLYNDPRITTFDEVSALGKTRKEKESSLFQEMVERVKENDIATFVYTSGTTGLPKAAMISHYNMLWGFFGLPTLYADVMFNEKTRTVAYLPLNHILARLQDAYLPMLCGYVTHFGESPETMAQTVFEVAPDFIWGPPRVYSKFAAQLIALVHSSSFIKRKAYDAAMNIGRRYIKRIWQSDVPLALRLEYFLAYWTVFRPLLDKVGFKRLKYALVAAAPVPPEMVSLWQIWGVNLLESYGGTEFGNGSTQVKPFSKPGSAGFPMPRVDYQVTTENELLLKSPGVFAGYYKNQRATDEYMENGWAHTGDLVRILEDGSIKICDRLKDLIKTEGGKGISPSEVERVLKASPYIDEAIAIGHGRKYVTVLIEIDFDTVSEWARHKGIIYSSYTSLATNPEVIKLIDDEIARTGEQLARVEQPKAFRHPTQGTRPGRRDRPGNGNAQGPAAAHRREVPRPYRVHVHGRAGGKNPGR